MGEVSAQLDRDQAIWSEWVSGLTQAEIGRHRGLDQSTISDAIARYQASVPQPERAQYRERMLARYEELYQAHREAALERPRVAAIVRGILDSEMRLLGLEPKELHVEHGGQVEHEHVDRGPTVEELLERWRAEGTLRVRGELTRTDGGGA